MTYTKFLSRKAVVDPMTGLIDIPELPECLFPFQRDIVNVIAPPRAVWKHATDRLHHACAQSPRQAAP